MRPRVSRLVSWPRRPGCHPRGCTSSWPTPGLDVLDARWVSCGRRAGPPAEDPDCGEDAGLGGRDSIAGRLSGEVSWLRQCAGWLAHLDADGCPPAVNRRPSAGWPDRAVVAAGLARVRAVIDRIAAGGDELATGR